MNSISHENNPGRKNLLIEVETPKYFKYAVVEIVLVIMDFLSAFNIQNKIIPKIKMKQTFQ